MTQSLGRPIANPSIVLREEFDDWAVLFDPDTGNGFGLSPTSVLIFKNLDGKHTEEDILKIVQDNCKSVPAKAPEQIREFVKDLVSRGFAGYEKA